MTGGGTRNVSVDHDRLRGGHHPVCEVRPAAGHRQHRQRHEMEREGTRPSHRLRHVSARVCVSCLGGARRCVGGRAVEHRQFRLLAVLYYRQFGELFNKRFVDEVGFAALAVAVPVVLMQSGMDTQWYLVPILLGFFVVYRVVDKRLNRVDKDDETSQQAVGSLPFGLILGLSALIAIAIAGMFLGGATAEVVEQLGVHPALAGWILGVVTSIPEMVSFFAVYAAATREGKLRDLNDTQEALDNLTGSNMANVGIVYPIGLLAFLLGASLFGG